MKKITPIQLKAALLLVVLGLNTLVSFACAMGLDLGSKTSHHKEEATEPSFHINADGKKHHHQPEPAKANVHVHADGKKHDHHHEPANQLPEEKETQKKDKDGCCNDDVLKFQNLDKYLNKNARTVIDVPAFVAALSAFLEIELFKTSATPQLPVIRYLFPPPPDILISIQRFQI